MSLQPTWSMEIPPDTTELGRRLLGENNVYRLVGDEVNDVLHINDFTDMYSVSGRGGIDPIKLALVTLFQFLENIPDRVAEERVVMRIDWKYALHVPLDYQGFDYSTLSYFRRRLLKHDKERVVFDRIVEWVGRHGFLKKRGKQRTDSTHIIGCVARLTRLELVWETLRVALRALKKAHSEWYDQHIPAVFDEKYCQRQSDWRLSSQEITVEMKKAGTDGYWLLDLVSERGPTAARELPEVVVLEQVLSQQYERQNRRVGVRQPPIRGKKRSRVRTNRKRGTQRSAGPNGLATELT
jgi:transposase